MGRVLGFDAIGCNVTVIRSGMRAMLQRHEQWTCRREIDKRLAVMSTGMAFAGNRTAGRAPLRERISLPFAVLIMLLTVCVLGGGSSRADVLSLLYVRPLAVAAFAFFAWQQLDWPIIRPLAMLLAAMALLCLLQLLPLPPAIYGLLSGREALDAIQQLNDTASDWRSVSIDPDATLNALVSLIIPAAVLLGLASSSRARRNSLLLPLIGFLATSAVLGMAQVASGSDGAFYLYRNTYPGYAVGWFANRNHQAAALACLFPLLRAWAALDGGPIGGRARSWTAVVLALLVMPMIVATGSRAGLALGLVSLVLSLMVAPLPAVVRSRRGRLVAASVIILVLALSIAMLLLGRAASVNRLVDAGAFGSEGRMAYLPVEWRVFRTFWPLGIGAGAFDPAIRMMEPDALLHTTYFNHAHNDFIEMALIGGVPAIMLMAVALASLVRWTVLALRSFRTASPDRLLARAAAVMLWVMVLASTVDYPLRSPLMASMMTIAAVWLVQGTRSRAGVLRLP